MVSCTWKKVRLPTRSATTIFNIFAAKDDLIAGVGATEHDFGDTGFQDCLIILDVDELADTSLRVDVYTRETETDAWGEPINSSSIEAVDCIDGSLFISRYRYVRVVVTVTGSDLVAGITGF